MHAARELAVDLLVYTFVVVKEVSVCITLFLYKCFLNMPFVLLSIRFNLLVNIWAELKNCSCDCSVITYFFNTIFFCNLHVSYLEFYI